MCSSKTDDGDSDVPQTSNGSDKLDLAKPRAKQRAEKLQAAAEAKYAVFLDVLIYCNRITDDSIISCQGVKLK